MSGVLSQQSHVVGQGLHHLHTMPLNWAGGGGGVGEGGTYVQRCSQGVFFYRGTA